MNQRHKQWLNSCRSLFCFQLSCVRGLVLGAGAACFKVAVNAEQ